MGGAFNNLIIHQTSWPQRFEVIKEVLSSCYLESKYRRHIGGFLKVYEWKSTLIYKTDLRALCVCVCLTHTIIVVCTSLRCDKFHEKHFKDKIYTYVLLYV